jgi:hypothetical protein
MAKGMRDEFYFEGFENPTTTPTPDVVFDELLSRLTGAELKVLLYIIRRTYGFKKNIDPISLTQITSGIVTRDGRVLDKGTGLDRSSAIKAAKGLVEKGVVTVQKEKGEDGVNMVNVYGLRFRSSRPSATGVVEKNDYGSGKNPLGVVEKNHPQETVLQETVKQDFNLSKFEKVNTLEKEGAPLLQRRMAENGREQTEDKPYSETIAREVDRLTKLVLNDVAHLKANTTQALNLWKGSRLSEKEFISLLREARIITEEHSGKIKKKADNYFGMKNGAPYFFRVLRNLIVQYRRQNLHFTMKTMS